MCVAGFVDLCVDAKRVVTRLVVVCLVLPDPLHTKLVVVG